MTTPPAPRRRDDPRMRTVEMEALSASAVEEESETLTSGPITPPLTRQRTMLLVGLGGLVGGVLRELLTLLLPTITTPTLIEIPRSALLVNVIGCVGLGVVTGILEKRPDAPRWLRPLVGIGFLEGFTIYSGVVLVGSAMIGADFPALAFMYGGITVFGALLGVALGMGLATFLHRRLGRARGAAPVPTDEAIDGESPARGDDQLRPDVSARSGDSTLTGDSALPGPAPHDHGEAR